MIRDLYLDGPGRDDALATLLHVARFMCAELGYRYRLDGWELHILRPDGSLAMRATATDQKQLAELQAIAQAASKDDPT